MSFLFKLKFYIGLTVYICTSLKIIISKIVIKQTILLYTVCPEHKMDIVFLLDGSGSIGKHFKNIKDWTKQLAFRLYKIDKICM